MHPQRDGKKSRLGTSKYLKLGEFLKNTRPLPKNFVADEKVDGAALDTIQKALRCKVRGDAELFTYGDGCPIVKARIPSGSRRISDVQLSFRI